MKNRCEDCVRLHAEAERWKKKFAIAHAENGTLLDERLLAWDEIWSLREQIQILNEEELDDAEAEVEFLRVKNLEIVSDEQ
jgi:hypothetical protein